MDEQKDKSNQDNYEGKNYMGRFSLSDIKTYFRATIINTI